MLWQTVSNAAVRSTSTQTVRCGGFRWLKPVAISVVSWSRAEVVEWAGQNPCWSGDGRRWLLSSGKMRASVTFAAGQSSEIGRYDVPCEESLPGLGMGMTNEVFQIEGIRLNLKESLKRAVKYSVALRVYAELFEPLAHRASGMMPTTSPRSNSPAQIMIHYLHV